MRVAEVRVSRHPAHAAVRVAHERRLDPLPGGQHAVQDADAVERVQAVRLQEQGDALGGEPRPPFQDGHAQAGVGAHAREGKAAEARSHDGDVDHPPRLCRSASIAAPYPCSGGVP